MRVGWSRFPKEHKQMMETISRANKILMILIEFHECLVCEQIKKLCNWLRWGGASLAPCVLAKIDQGGSSAPLSHCLGQCAISLVTAAWDNHSSGGRLFGNQPGWISLAAPTKQNSCYWSAEGVARVWREWHLLKVSRVHIDRMILSIIFLLMFSKRSVTFQNEGIFQYLFFLRPLSGSFSISFTLSS